MPPSLHSTLIDSTPAVNATWAEFAVKYGLDYDYVVSGTLGRAARYTFCVLTCICLCPILTAAILPWLAYD